jgi:hypothetical protein
MGHPAPKLIKPTIPGVYLIGVIIVGTFER